MSNNNNNAKRSSAGDPLLIPLADVEERVLLLRSKLNDPHQNKNLTKDQIMTTVTELQPLYKRLIMADVDAAVARQMESYLWNDCFKKPLTYFLKIDKAFYNMIIETGVGFYLAFIQDAGLQFDVSFVKNSVKSLGNPLTKMKALVKCSPSKGAVYYILQNCMIHVADLLRYGGNLGEAQKMYDKSTSVCPANGQPFHQMGLVQQLMDIKSINSILSSLYCFTRALSTDNPFLIAQKNLEDLLLRTRELSVNVKFETLEEHLIFRFIENIDVIVMNNARDDPLPRFVAAMKPESRVSFPIENLTFAQVFRMIVIALWAWKRESDKNSLGIELHNEGKALTLLASLLNAILQTGSWREIGSITAFLGLAHLNILLNWIRLHPFVLSNTMFRETLNAYYLCDVSDRIIRYGNQFLAIANELSYVILPEEKKLLGFLPMKRSYDHLQSVMDESDRRAVALRVIRYLKLVESLCGSRFHLIYRCDTSYYVLPTVNLAASPFGNYQRQKQPAMDVIFKEVCDEIGRNETRKVEGQEKVQKKPGLFSTALAKKLASEAKESEVSKEPFPSFEDWLRGSRTGSASSQNETHRNGPVVISSPFMSPKALRTAVPVEYIHSVCSYSGLDSNSPATGQLYEDYSLLYESVWTPRFGQENYGFEEEVEMTPLKEGETDISKLWNARVSKSSTIKTGIQQRARSTS